MTGRRQRNRYANAFWHTANDLYDIIAFQEPWWGDIGNGQRGAVSPGPGWRCILPVKAVKHAERPRVLTFYRIRAGMRVVPRYDLIEDLDAMAIEVQQQGRLPVLLFNVYNEHPLQDADGGGDRRQRDQMSTTVQRMLGSDLHQRLPQDVPVILTGDWNLHHPLWQSMAAEPTREARELVLWMQENGLTIVNEPDEPTYFSRHSTSRSVLDLTFVNQVALREATVRDWHIDPASTLSSDHAGLVWCLDPGQEPVDNASAGQYNWKKADVDLFKRTLREELDARMHTFAALRDEGAWLPPAVLDTITRALHDALQVAADKAVPVRRPSTYAKPFWDAELDAAKEEIVRAKLELAAALLPDVIEELAKVYTHHVRRLRRLVKKKKRAFYRARLENATSKDMWEFPRWTKGKRQYPTPPIFRGEGVPPATEHADKCAALRDALFAPPPDLGHAYPDLAAPHPEAAQLHRVTRAQVYAALTAPDPDKSPGPSSVPNRALRWAWDVAEDELYLLIAHCAHTGYHPELWRRSISACLPKVGKPDYTRPRAHRLIQCLECLGKVLEVVETRIIAHFALKHGLTAETQFGGVPGRSVEDAALTFTHDVETAARRRLATSALTFDITGYFDRVSHPRLLTVLREGGLPHPVVRWVSSFLAGRETAIRLDGETGSMAPVTTGIPQGSPVSPILAAIFSRTLDDRIRAAAPGILARIRMLDASAIEGRLIMFVDDGKLYVSSSSLDTNVQHLRELYKVARAWARDEGLILDDEKQDFTHFTCSLQKLDGTPVRQLARPALRLPNNSGGESTIRPAESYRWLGIHWDPRLNFATHVKRMAARASGVVNAMRMLGNTMSGLSPLFMRSIHIACTLSILCFGASVWYKAKRQGNLIQCLEVVLRAAMRQILGAFRTTPTEVLNIETSIPPLDLILDARRERAALRLARMPDTHPVIQRLGADWHRGAQAVNPPPLQPMRTNVDSKRTRLQRLALLYPADGERIDAHYLAPWSDILSDPRWKGRLVVVPKDPKTDKRRAALAHVELARSLRADERHVLAYSDGSLLEGSAGAGAAVFHCRRQVTAASYGLGTGADVYDAELSGLAEAARKALPFAASLPVRGFTHVHFFADNDSSIRSVLKCRPAAGQAFCVAFTEQVTAFLLEDERRRVSVEWVPGHEDVAGQEATDRLAKAGTRQQSSLPFELSITRAKRAITTRTISRWIERWHAPARRNRYAAANRIQPSLRPTRHLRAHGKSVTARLTQCRSGHAHTGEYNLAINKPERGLACCCGAALQTRDHLLTDCPEYERYRGVLRDASPALSVTHLLGTHEGIAATAKFLRRSGAFGRPTTEGVEDAAHPERAPAARAPRRRDIPS